MIIHDDVQGWPFGLTNTWMPDTSPRVSRSLSRPILRYASSTSLGDLDWQGLVLRLELTLPKARPSPAPNTDACLSFSRPSAVSHIILLTLPRLTRLTSRSGLPVLRQERALAATQSLELMGKRGDRRGKRGQPDCAIFRLTRAPASDPRPILQQRQCLASVAAARSLRGVRAPNGGESLR